MPRKEYGDQLQLDLKTDDLQPAADKLIATLQTLGHTDARIVLALLIYTAELVRKNAGISTGNFDQMVYSAHGILKS